MSKSDVHCLARLVQRCDNEIPKINGIVITLKILITAVKDIDNATSPFANEVSILEVAPPGAAANIITPIAISGDNGQIDTKMRATIGKIIN